MSGLVKQSVAKIIKILNKMTTIFGKSIKHRKLSLSNDRASLLNYKPFSVRQLFDQAQHIFAYVSTHTTHISIMFIFWSVWEITYLRLYKQNISTLGQVQTRTDFREWSFITRRGVGQHLQFPLGLK